MSQNHWIVRLSESGHVMGWVVVTLVLFCAPCVIAQTGIMSPPPPEMGFTLDPKIKVSPSMAIILVCLISAFFLMGCVSVYVRHCAERHMSFPVVDTEPGGSQRSRRASARGLDPAEIDAVPMFLYSDVKGHKIGKVALECAVCLNEFEDDETLRLLPKCSHVFHPDCIDAWLSSHVTCPVCRANLVPPPGETRPVRVLSQDPYDSDDSSRLNDSVRAVDDFTIDVDPPEAINPSQTPNQNRPPRWTPSKLRSSGRFPRSHSVGHTVVEPGENCERFTLRLPEEVRSRLVTSSSSLSRTRSCVAFPRARSTRKGYRSSSTGGGGRGKYYERFDREGPSDRWGFTMTPPFFSRAGSARSKVGGADDLTATPRSISRSVKSPFDRLFGGTDKDNRGERSFDRLKTDGQS